MSRIGIILSLISFSMKSQTILVIAIIISLCSCKSKRAMDYNNMIVKKQKTLSESIDNTEPILKQYFTSFQYDSIVNVSGRMEKKIDSIIKTIKNKPVPPVKQGENFKKAALHYFSFMKDIYTSYKNYGLQTSPEGRQIQREIMSKVIAQEDIAIADMQKAQQIFAKDNGFKISSSKKKENNSLTASPPNQ
jgi:hypothetical protein